MSRTVSQPVKLLFVDHTPFAGGAQLVLADHIAELDKSQFEVHVACTDAVPQLLSRYEAAGAQVHIITMPRLRSNLLVIFPFLAAVWNLRKLIQRLNISIVISNTTRASYVATLATLFTSAETMWWVRDYLYPRPLFKLLQHRVRRIIFVSESIKSTYVSESDPKGEVVYVANNLYKVLPDVSRQQIQAERDKWGFDDSDVVVGFMGRLVAEKGAEDLVQAIKTLRPKYPQVKALIVGTGKNQMHDVEKKLHQVVKAEGLEGVIVFAGYQGDEPLYYSLFDIFVLATRDGEPFATSVVQAMMAGKPVIGSNCGGTPEIIVEGETGLLFAPHNPQSLAEAIRRMLDDTNLRNSVAEAGQNRVLQYHREEIVTDRIEEIYREVLGISK